MKPTKKLEKEVMIAYNAYWDSYLKGDIKTMASFMDDDIKVIGSTETEVFYNKKTAMKFYSATADQIAGTAQLRNRDIKIELIDGLVLITEKLDFYALINRKWTFYAKGRLSSLLWKKEDGWKFIQQHGSIPDTRAGEGEQLSVEKISKENFELREAVKRRTVELENKNLELEIEASLEKVRAQAMGMRKPEKLPNVCEILFKELQALGFAELRNAMINIYTDDKNTLLNYDYAANSGKTVTVMPYDIHPLIEKQVSITKNAHDAFYEFSFAGNELKQFRELRKNNGELDDPKLEENSSLHYYFYSIGTGSIGISTYSAITENKLDLLKRFRNVFNLAYQRYTDIALAEAQAKEAQIELSLERVRARTMAMQKSDELPDAANILFQQAQLLGMPAWSAGYCIWDEDKTGITLWMSSEGVMQQSFHAPLTTDPSFIHMREAYERGESFFVEEVGGQALIAHYQYMRTLPVVGEILDSIIAAGHPLPVFQIFHLAFFSQGFLLFITYEPVPEAHDIFKRFAKVFEQTYTRFLDLQKAEAQAKEAQIETALERVRSRSMGMQKSDELKEVIKIVYQQLTHLKINLDHAGFVVDYAPGGDWHFWIADEQDIPSKISHPYFESVWANQFKEAKDKGADIFTTHLNFEEKNKFYHELLSYIPGLPEASKDFYLNRPGLAASTVLFENVSLYIENFFGTPYSDEDNKTLMRFGKVFQQTYTRFLDLQKAEAQSREAQIELGLERVRARAMAMQKSDELSELVDTVFKELTKLDFALTWCIINIIDESSRSNTVWAANPDIDKVPESYHMLFEDYPFHDAMMKGYKEKATKYIYVVEGNEKKIYDEYLFNETEFRKVPTEAQAASRAMEKYVVSFSFSNFGGLQTVGDAPLSDANLDILSRFGKVFDLTYTRFNDLQNAEAQAREAKIEAALERTRTQSMIMQHSNELDNTLRVFHEQVLLLGIPSAFSFLWLPDEKNDRHIFWAAWAQNNSKEFSSKAINYPLDRNEPATAQCLVDWKSNEPVYSYHVPPAAVQNYFAAWQELIDGVEQLKPQYFSGGLYYVEAFMKYGCFGVMVTTDLRQDEKKILGRFAIEFERTYTRFLDLQKAEAQARESQIELALERVRARTMAMQKSDELPDAALLLSAQVKDLGVQLWSTSFQPWDNDRKAVTAWTALKDIMLKPFKIPATEDSLMINISDATKKGELLYVEEMGGKVLENHVKYMNSLPGVKEEFGKVVNAGFSFPTFNIFHAAYFSTGFILFITEKPYPEAHDIFKRFAKVFEQTYTRFLDLQKSEAQARESQIQLAMERVRARTMAMQHSNELADAATLLFQQMQPLDIPAWSTGYCTWEDDKQAANFWMSSEGLLQSPFKLPLTEEPVCIRYREAYLQGEAFYAAEYSGEKLASMYAYMMEFPAVSNMWNRFSDEGTAPIFPASQVNHVVYFAQGFLLFVTHQHVPEAHDIFKRFGKVFEQTYTRFLDLQKAEAQAREAQIEAALERVRSVAMSMMKSDELLTVCEAVFVQLETLGFSDTRAAQIYIRYDEEEKFLNYDYSNISGSEVVEVKYNSHPKTRKIYDTIRNAGDALIDNIISNEELIAWKSYLYNILGQKPEKNLDAATELHYYLYSFGIGAFGVCTYSSLDDEKLQILKRFRNVFNLCYQRYTDIALAEAQAREAKIETALERVRSRTLAMQKSDELAETSAVLFQQLISLGIEPNRLYITIIKDEEGDAEFWITDEDGTRVSAAYTDNLNTNPSFKKMLNGWKEKQPSLIMDMHGQELQDYFTHLTSLHVPFKDGLTHTRRIQHLAYFNKGFIGIASPDGQPLETIRLLERFAAVFNLTYTRFNDLQIAEAHAVQAAEDLVKLHTEKKRAEDALNELRVTQKQLVQSEKMASLGELTAGIAHEIQNPLNFVNNFSEVSTELVNEMNEEIAKGNLEEARQIAEDLKQNLEKINHHGKRAGDIVKGMLQHSRTGSGQTEPTDINKLADEYLRLAYHGLRAKDKSFNATLNTNYDETIGNINIVPQDIGRVILNLITNAFYAVNEKKKAESLKPKAEGKAYEPVVTVTTRRLGSPSGDGGKISIHVSDNGNGIPQKVVDKIFQPFFTTKPTGQGTGLGLSLSYDIVKAHGGEIKVESKEGEGTLFIVLLPQ